MSGASLRLLVNPTAGGGRAARRRDAVEAALRRHGPVDVVHTTRTGDERRLAGEAWRDGVRVLAVLGGDGTLHHVAAGLLDAPPGAVPAPAIAAFGAGTGNDFVKSLARTASRDGGPGSAPPGPRSLEALAARAAQAAAGDAGALRDVDVGWLTAADGTRRPVLNAAGLGFDADVLARTLAAGAGGRRAGGPARYVRTALGRLVSYRGDDIEVSLDGDALPDGPRLTVVVANGGWFGGAFRIAPDARLDDGRLDVVAISDAPTWRRVRLFAAALRGGHVRHPGVIARRARHVVLRGPGPLRLQVDGELCDLGVATAEIHARPRALRFVG